MEREAGRSPLLLATGFAGEASLVRLLGRPRRTAGGIERLRSCCCGVLAREFPASLALTSALAAGSSFREAHDPKPKTRMEDDSPWPWTSPCHICIVAAVVGREAHSGVDGENKVWRRGWKGGGWELGFELGVVSACTGECECASEGNACLTACLTLQF